MFPPRLSLPRLASFVLACALPACGGGGGSPTAPQGDGFTLTSAYGRRGMWGATEDVTKLDSPKYRSLAQAATNAGH